MTKSIKINEKLKYYANFDPTKEMKFITIKKICEMIKRNEIVLPVFQTYIRWTVEKYVSLLNFQLTGKMGVSPLSINIIQKKNVSVSQVNFLTKKIIPKEELVGKQSIIDGQQRLCCNFKAYIDHEDFHSIVLDINKGKFLINLESLKPYQIPVGKLYNQDDSVFYNYIQNHKKLQSSEIFMLLIKLRCKFMDYYYIINYAFDLDEDEQLKWFKVLNLAGSGISNVELHLTKMFEKGIDFYKEYSHDFMEKISAFSLEYLFVKEGADISILLATLNPAFEVLTNKVHNTNYSPIPSDVKVSYISNLEKQEILRIFEITLIALDNSLSFIFENCLEPKRIEHLTYITGFFVYNNNQKVNDVQKRELIKWFNSVDFTNLGNKDRRKIFDYLITIKDLK